MFLVLNSMIPFPAPRRGIRVRVPRQAHLERQMLCLHIPCGMSVSCGQSSSGKPTPVPVRSLRTCSCFLCPANMCTGRMTNDHLPNLLSFLFVPFPPQRCETYSLRPRLLSSKKCGPTWLTFRIRSLYVTSSQVATKLTYDCLELPANLAGSCSESLMLVIRQKCGTSCPTFLRRRLTTENKDKLS